MSELQFPTRQQRRRQRIGILCFEGGGQRKRSIIDPPIDRDAVALGINNPILAHPFAIEQLPLSRQVALTCAGRQNLDDDSRCALDILLRENVLLVTEIYAAGEKPIPGVSGQALGSHAHRFNIHLSTASIRL